MNDFIDFINVINKDPQIRNKINDILDRNLLINLPQSIDFGFSQ